jgi:hypothetical protein
MAVKALPLLCREKALDPLGAKAARAAALLEEEAADVNLLGGDLSHVSTKALVHRSTTPQSSASRPTLAQCKSSVTRLWHDRPILAEATASCQHTDKDT